MQEPTAVAAVRRGFSSRQRSSDAGGTLPEFIARRGPALASALLRDYFAFS
jgi:hypothetical protein